MEHLGRRQVLTAAGAGVVAVAGLGGNAAAATAGSGHGRRFSGGWLVVRTNEGSPGEIRTVLTFADGGAFLALDIDPAASPLAGSWAPTGHHEFAATFWGSVTDPTGPASGTVRVKATGSVQDDRISGSYTFRAIVEGQEQTGSGAFRGTRINPE